MLRRRLLAVLLANYFLHLLLLLLQHIHLMLKTLNNALLSPLSWLGRLMLRFSRPKALR